MRQISGGIQQYNNLYQMTNNVGVSPNRHNPWYVTKEQT